MGQQLYLLTFSLINILPMAVNAQTPSFLQSVLKKHQVQIWKAQQLSQLLLQQGATSVDWKVEVWELGYEAKLKVNTSGQEVMEVYLESYLPGKSTKVYVNPQTKQTTVAQLYEGITEDENQRANQWLRYFDGKVSLLKVVNQILPQCNYRQTIKMTLQPQKIQINYINWRNARSIKHKKNYHMLKLEIAIAQDFPKSGLETFQFGKQMQVVFSDHSTQQNRREGERILDKIKALHQAFNKD